MDCQITVPLVGILKLVPRFIEKIAHIITTNESDQVSVNFTNKIKGLKIMDEHSP